MKDIYMFEIHCSVRIGDNLCDLPPDIIEPLPLCETHALRLAAVLLPRFLKGALGEMLRDASHASESWDLAFALTEQAEFLDVQTLLDGPHGSVVYFIRNGDRIKIGMTQNLRSRVSALSLRPGDIVCVLNGGRDLEKALHRRFFRARVSNTEWFEPAEDLLQLIKAKTLSAHPAPLSVAPEPIFEEPVVEQVPTQPEPVEPPAPRIVIPPPPPRIYPDGSPVGRDGQPDLYRAFEDLGSATKKELQKAGPFASRDTVGRAVEVWLQHGVQARREGRADRFYLPDSEAS